MRIKMLVMACVGAALMVAQVVWAVGPSEKGGVERRHHVVMHLNSSDEKVPRGALNNIRHLYQKHGTARMLVTTR